MTDAERTLMDRRLAGATWDELAGEFGGTPDAVRKRFERAVERVAGELGPDGEPA